MAKEIICVYCVSLLLLLGGCASSLTEDAEQVPQAVTERHEGDFDADVRKLVPDTGFSDPSCGLNGPAGIEKEVLQRLNSLRAKGRYCGAIYFEAAPPITWNLKLTTAAYGHALQMAQANLVSHTSIDQRELRNRVLAAGYRFSRVSENIAAGQRSVASVMLSWEKSPSHCANLMHAQLREVGVVCMRKDFSFYKFYWTMDLASPLIVAAPKENTGSSQKR